MIRRLAAALSLTLVVACGRGAGSGAAPGTIDLTADFLARVCPEPAGEPFAHAWLEHERRHPRVYEALYAAADDPAGRASAASSRGGERDTLCKQARILAAAAPALAAGLRPTVRRLMGTEPRAALLLAVPVAGNDGGLPVLDGRRVMALNAGAETYTRLSGTVVTIAHELVHDAQRARWGDELARLPAMSSALYAEGGAVFAMTILFPELGERATGLPAEVLAELDRAATAAELLTRLHGDDDGRWFRGGRDKLGYLMGLEIYRELGRTRGAEATLRMAPADFLRAARTILAASAAR